MANYYDDLGVGKNATESEIKKAYRAKAKQHHPDKGGNEADFKKINEAYEVLGNTQKKAQYDQFGTTGNASGGGMNYDFSGGGFGGFEDIFSNIFSGGFGGQQPRKQQTRGRDLETTIRISFTDSLMGARQSLNAHTFVACGTCDAAGGSDKTACATCGGRGSVTQKMQTPLGAFQQQVPCQSCRGEGVSFAKKCAKCAGEGRVKERRTVEVEVPEGVEHGQTLRLGGQGEAGRRGAQAGDLYVTIEVAPSSEWKRKGLDLISRLQVPVFEALSGGVFSVKTFWGNVDITVPELTKEGTLLRLKGKGVKSSGRAGDHYVEVEYVMPKRVNTKLKKLLSDAAKMA